MNTESAVDIAVEGPAHAHSEPNFDRLAPLYRWMEWLSFGPFLARCRRAFLPELETSHRALVLGDGDGRFTAALLRTNPTIEIDAFDISPAMLHRLSHRAKPHASRLHTEVQDLRWWTPPGTQTYDLVVTHFFLDCLTTEEVRNLAARVRPCLAPGAEWIVSEFSIPAKLYGRLVVRPIVTCLYGAFRLLTGLRTRRLPRHEIALAETGFLLQSRRHFLGGMLVSQKWFLPPTST